MPSILHHCILPFLRGRYNQVGGRLGLPRPDDNPRAHAPGIDPDRILVFGNGAAVGWGVRSHDLALPGHLARKLSHRTGRGVDVEVVADPGITIKNAGDALPGDRLASFDAVVIVLGVSDALRLTSARSWRAGLEAVLDRICAESHGGAEILLMGVHRPSSLRAFSVKEGSLVDKQAALFDEISREICRNRDGVTFLAAPVESEEFTREGDAPRGSVSDAFQVWAGHQADRLAPLLDARVLACRTARQTRNLPQSDEVRLSAIRALRILDSPHEKRFDDIVERTRVLLGTAGAAFSVIDEDRVWNKSFTGSMVQEAPLRGAMCGETIRSGTPFVVPDVWHDDRFVTHPAVRFYAGHPIETPEGVRIGALCVMDPEPRGVDSVDLVLLRELALSVQRELAEGVVPAGSVTSDEVVGAY
ncbi:GAF domain-containing protein [Frondihabitans cladoniiphilus]|uniref:GAF domain-containing protein n=1 Tax=Frondihabitans cladoniiphilus TaxID=715785 RepID=A0ABP8VT94_9MICO